MTETFDIAAEQALLGTLLTKNDALALVESIVQPEHFFEGVHQETMRVLVGLIQAGKHVNPTTLRPHLPANMSLGDNLPTLGAYIARLAAESVPVSQVVDYAWVVRNFADKRALAEIGASLMPETVADLALCASEAIDALDAIVAAREPQNTVGTDMTASAERAVKAMADAYQRKGEPVGTPYGIKALDDKLSGASAGELTLIAARPSMGKTALAMNIARNHATRGRRALIWSLEMDATSLTNRLIADTLYDTRKVKYTAMRSGRLHESDFDPIFEASREVGALPIRVEQPSAVTWSQIAARTRQYHRRNPLGSIWIDHIGYVRLPGRNQVQELGDVTKGAKALARELGVPIFLLAQLNRGLEGREDKRPNLSDIRASGSLEEDADTVMMVYREAYYLERKMPSPGTPDFEAWQDKLDACVNTMSVLIEKNRHGSIGTVNLFCDMACNVVRDLGYVPTRNVPPSDRIQQEEIAF